MSRKPNKPEGPPPRISVTRDLPFDQDRLISCPLSEAIKYLQELQELHGDKNPGLEDTTYSYDTMEISLRYVEEESDREYEYRMEEMRLKEKHNETIRQHRLQRDRDLAELKRLKQKLGQI